MSKAQIRLIISWLIFITSNLAEPIQSGSPSLQVKLYFFSSINVGLIIPGIAPLRDTLGGRWLYQNKKIDLSADIISIQPMWIYLTR